MNGIVKKLPTGELFYLPQSRDRYFQDGNRFYCIGDGTHVYTASVKVKDFDMDAAEQADREFISWLDRNDIENG